MRYDDQLCDSSSDRQCGQLVAPPALYIGSLGTRQAPGTITFPASGQSVSSPHSSSWACVSRIWTIVRRYARSDLQGVISAKSVWELFIGVKKVCDKIWQKLQYKVLFMAKIALNKSYGGNNG